MMPLLRWPHLRGLTMEDQRYVCIESKNNRHWFFDTKLPSMPGPIAYRRDKIKPDDTPENRQILVQALMNLTVLKHRENVLGWLRGSPVCQIVNRDGKSMLYLYEAGYRESMYPRYKWTTCTDNVCACLWDTLRIEVASAMMLAEIDTRKAVTVEP